MADFGSFFSPAAAPKIDGADQVNQGVQQAQQVDTNSLNLAQGYNKLQADMDNHANAMQEHQENQAQFAYQQVSNAMSIQNPAARAMAMKKAVTLMGIAKIPVDDTVVALSKDNDFRNNYISATSKYMDPNNTLPDEQKSALLDHLALLNNGADLEKSVTSMAAENTSRGNFAIQRGIEARRYGNEQNQKKDELTQTARTNAVAQTKDDVETMKFGNDIIRAANDPSQRTDAVAASAATANMLKTMFPQGTIKEGEIKYGQKISAGVANDIKAWMQAKAGEGEITPEMWKMMGVFAQHRTNNAYENTLRNKSGVSKSLSAAGIDPEDVYSFVPKPENFTGIPSDGLQAQASAAPAAPAASAAPAAPEASAQQAPPALPPESPYVHQYSKLSPESQNGLQAVAKQLGVSLDPASPSFSQGWQQVYAYLAKHPANAQPAATAAAAPAPGKPAAKLTYDEKVAQMRAQERQRLADDRTREDAKTRRDRSGGSFNQ